MALNLMAVSWRTISLGHALIDYAFGAAILLVHSNPDGGDEDGPDGVCSAVKSGDYCAAKTIPLSKTLALRELQQPLVPAMSV